MSTGTLPKSAKKTWETIYNSALKGSCKGDKGCAASVAWSQIKEQGWRKVDGKWAKKSEALQEFSMYITKSGTDGKVMRWSAVNSDTDPDTYTERMSYELYKDFESNIENNVPVPEQFKSITSRFWKGGMPYLSVSHYPDLDGQAVPGEPSIIFIDGDSKKARLKAKGILYDTPLGNSVYRSLQEDKNRNPEDRIRISIGFLDLAHRHGDNPLWVRKGLYDVCPECLDGVGNKVYVKGYLVHLALTRVPVNKRTEMVLEEKSEMTKKITRKQDAASIVGASLADEIDAKHKVSALKSDALVEMSEGEEPTEEETKELIEEAEKGEGVSEIADYEDRTENEEVSQEELVLESETKKPELEEKDMGMNVTMPYGGATSMKDAQKSRDAQEEMTRVMDLWSMFSNVAWNIMDSMDVTDKKSAFVKALDEFKGMLAAKAMVEFSVATPVVELSEVKDHVLKPALDALLSAVDNSLSMEGDINNKLQFVNPSLQELGQAITDYVTQKSAVEPTAPNNNDNNLLENIKELIQPLSQSVQQLTEKVAIIESKSNAQGVQTQSRIPQPRSLPASLVQKATPAVKPGSVRDIVNKSVGLS